MITTEEDRELVDELRRQWRESFETGIAPIRHEVDDIKTRLKLFGERTSRPPGGVSTQIEQRDLPGQKFVSSSEFLAWKSSPGQRGRVVLASPFTKAIALLNTQVKPAPVRLPDILPLPALPPAMVLLLGWRPVQNTNAVEFLRESVAPAPGAASQAGEGALKAEQTISVELISEAIETVAAWTSLSLQALNDTAQLQRFIDETLTRLVLNEIDRQLLSGLGPASHELHGILPSATAYDTALTLIGDGPLDIISHAQAQLYASGVVATAVVLSPADAEAVRLTKDSTGNFLWGSPAAGAPASVWGLTPVVDGNLSAGFVVGDFTARSIELLMREEMITELSREHADYFVKNLCAIRTEARCANGLYRPSAFVTGTFPAVAPGGLRR